MPNYSGIWTLQAQMQAKAQENWTGISFDSLYTWGTNDTGQLGQGNVVNRSSPTQVGSGTDWSNINMGDGFTVVTKLNGTLWSWGNNLLYGPLGQGNTISLSSPVQVGALTNWLRASSGNNNTAAIKTDGTLWTWGNNNRGQLGQNNDISRSSPVQVGSGTDWSITAARTDNVFAIKTDGTLWSWGFNTSGQLGQNNTTYSVSSPVQIGSDTNWSKIACGNRFALAIKSSGTLWAWGRANEGQLGLNIGGANYNKSSPTQVGALTNWLTVSCGSYFSIAVKTDGTLWSWGYGAAKGQNNNAYNSSPVQVGALTTWASVAAGNSFTLAITTNGALWSWGTNGSGQLGQGNTIARSSPVQVGSSTSWFSIAANTQSIATQRFTT
jgi:alpha-tubulin suppressor-like RCC1 family protein